MFLEKQICVAVGGKARSKQDNEPVTLHYINRDTLTLEHSSGQEKDTYFQACSYDESVLVQESEK